MGQHPEEKERVPEGRREEQPAKPRRFRLIRLEERIAPQQGGRTKYYKCTSNEPPDW